MSQFVTWDVAKTQIASARIVTALGESADDDALLEGFVEMLTSGGLSDSAITKAIIADAIPIKWVTAMTCWMETSSMVEAVKELF